eukprot:jgi/Psemu1/318613/estExt_fgenesh1_pm.C_970004
MALTAFSTNNRNQQCIILDTGCTSVYHLTDGSSLVAGTKKGGMHYFFSRVQKERDDLGEDPDPVRNNYAKIDANEDGMWSRSELKSRDYETKYPVYSIATASQKGKNSLSGGPEESFLFFGSGDRWISVWKLTYNDFDEYPQDENRATQAPIFDYVQKLGPHTGWVKALVYDDTNEILHSIGCNCIESWNCSRLNGYHLKRDNDDESSLPIFHITKRTIENCPNLGTTLSSDLLCLCLIKSTIGNDEGLCPLLVSGGVDGRIHLWISDPSVKRKQDLSSFDGRTPLHTTLAHNGRVNAIAYSSAMGTIFTVGNDGVLAVFRVSSDDEFESIFKLEIVDVSTKESASRLTDVSITMEHRETGECSLAVGTSKGEVYFTTAKLKSDGDVTCQLKNDHVTVKEGSMIYSLSCERNKGTKLTPRIWIGHASGLVTLDV